MFSRIYLHVHSFLSIGLRMLKNAHCTCKNIDCFFRYFFALLTLYICVYNKDMLDIWWFIDIMTQINIKKNYFVINLCHGFRFWLLEVSIKYSLNSLILIIISITFYGVQKQPFYLQYLLQFNNLHKLTSLKWRIIAINIWIMRCHYQ